MLSQDIGVGEQRAGVPTPGSPSRLWALRASSEIEIDGRLDEEAWESAPVFRGFVQREPMEGDPAMNDTEIRVLFDDDAVYVGAILYDSRPEAIARNLTRRDAPYSGQFDYLAVMLDPNLDGRTGYEFRVSAANVQADAYLFDDTERDVAWDAVWESAVSLDERGWVVEIRIPFSQIRYESTERDQVWGINVHRRRAADNEYSSFALEPRLASGRVSRFGRLHGIRVPGNRRRAEVRPYAVSRVSLPAEASDASSSEGREIGAGSGVELRYGLGSSFTLDATLNPDFGQVESDPAVINLTAAETFFQEHRPFFVEDARVFDFDLTVRSQQYLFYSCRVGRSPQVRGLPGADVVDVPDNTRILGAAKLTGRTPGGLSVGALAALTGRELGKAYFEDEARVERFVAEPSTAYGVVRLHQDLWGGASRVGGIITGVRRSLPPEGGVKSLPSEAFTLGIDFEHSWADRQWILWGFLAGSHVRGDSVAILRLQRSSTHYLQRPDLERGALDPTATRMSGGEWRLQLDRRGGRWQGELWAGQIMPGFEVNDLGFRNQFERLSAGLALEYLDVAPTHWSRDYSIRFFTIHDWSHEVLHNPFSWAHWRWAQTRNNFSLTGSLTLLNYWSLGSTLRLSPHTMSRESTRGGPRMVDPGSIGWSFDVSTDNRRVVSFQPAFSVNRGLLDSGDLVNLSLRTRIQPSPWLEFSLRPTLSRLTNGLQYVASSGIAPYPPTLGERYIFSGIERLDLSMEARANLTLTPDLSVEFFGQPLVSSAAYAPYKQLRRSESYQFDVFAEGKYREDSGTVWCEGGRTCRAPSGLRWIDPGGTGEFNFTLPDQDFNLRSLRTTAVVRWEYRPGSTLYFVWQRRQGETANVGDFDFSRDARALIAAPKDDVFMVKGTLWFTL